MALVLQLPKGDAPLYLRIADAVADAVHTGRLPPNAALPGTRALAADLQVHRNTVIAAYRELAAQGFLAVNPRGTTRVAPQPPTARLPKARCPSTCPYVLPTPSTPWMAPPAGTLWLAGGRPDLRTFPVAELARAWRNVVTHSRGRILDYGDPRGHPTLRSALASMLARERGLRVGPEEVLITRGSQQALYLTAMTLLRPGDRVAVERLGYPPAWAALRAIGAELVPIDVDRDGLVVDQLADAAEAGPLRAVYCTPHHQYPTMATMTPERRGALLVLARTHRFAVLEDDYDYAFHFASRPVLPLASQDEHGSVIYAGTFSKMLAPGLRLGFVCAPRPVVDAITATRVAVDRQGDSATEAAIALLLEDGTADRHFRKMRRVYASRQAVVAQALREKLGDRVSFEVPAGGLALWVHHEGDVEAWQQRALRAGVGFDAGGAYHFDGVPIGALRIGFAALDEAQLLTAVGRLAASL